jgi:hypothetical protein
MNIAPPNPRASWRIGLPSAQIGVCYLSGPITGHDDYVDDFARAETLALLAGARLVVNPARNLCCIPNIALPACSEKTYRIYMAMDMAALSLCDSILLLPGWESSCGARAEEAYARSIGLSRLLILTGEEAPRG